MSYSVWWYDYRPAPNQEGDCRGEDGCICDTWEEVIEVVDKLSGLRCSNFNIVDNHSRSEFNVMADGSVECDCPLGFYRYDSIHLDNEVTIHTYDSY